MAPNTRARTAAVEHAAKKRKVDSVLAGKCDVVAAALDAAPGLPVVARQMLTGMVRAIPPHGALPHDSKYGDALTGMITDALETVQKRIDEEISAADAKVRGGNAEKAARESAVVEAQRRLQQQADICSERKSALMEASKACVAAQEALTAAQAAQQAGDAEVKEAADKKDALQTVYTESIEPLTAGRLEQAAATKKASALAKVWQEHNLDESIRTAMPTALSKEPSVRGSFDNMVIQQVNETVQARLQSLQVLVDNGAPAKAEREAAVEAARTAVDAAKEKQHASAAEMRQAQSDHKDAESALQAKEAEANSLLPELSASSDALEAARARLEVLRTGALAAWQEVSAPPPPPSEEAAAVEEAEAAAPEPPTDAA